MKIGLDIDGTISRNPEFFAELTRHTYAEGGAVVVITSRLDTGYARIITEGELKGWSIRYDTLYMFEPYEEVEHLCPHGNLDWYRKYVWQKIHHALSESLDIFYEDDAVIIDLFESYAPNIEVVNARQIAPSPAGEDR